MTEVFAPFFIMVLLGYLWGPLARRVPALPSRESVREVFGAVVFHVFLPALSFHVIYRAPIGRETWAVPLSAAFACVVTALVALALFRQLQRWTGRTLQTETLGALVLASAWPNATYLGLPILRALFGEPARQIAILFDLFAMTPLLLTLGAVLAMRYGRRMRGPGPMSAGASLIPIGAAVLGLLLRALEVPVPATLLRACELLGQAVAPMMIFTVGLSLRFTHLRKAGWAVPAAGLKLVLAPLLAWMAARTLGLDGMPLRATVMEAGMPSMVLTLVMAERFGLDTELLAIVIALTTLLAFLTLPWIATAPL